MNDDDVSTFTLFRITSTMWFPLILLVLQDIDVLLGNSINPLKFGTFMWMGYVSTALKTHFNT